MFASGSVPRLRLSAADRRPADASAGWEMRLRGAGRAARAGGGMCLDFARMPGIELIVDESMQHDFCFLAGHGPFSSASQAARNSPRARARRDITVPTGTPVTSAISR